MGVAPKHWAITNSSAGDDTNSGVFDGGMDNAVKTWQELWDKMGAEHNANDFLSPQIIHVSNHSAFSLPSAVTRPDGTMTNFHTSMQTYGCFIVPFEEDTNGLYHTYPQGFQIPRWEIDCSTPGKWFDDAYARPYGATFTFGHLSGLSGTNGFYAGSYQRFKHMVVDCSTQPVGNGYTAYGLLSVENCRLIGGGNYGLRNSFVVRNNHFQNPNGNRVVWAGLNSVIENNIFEDLTSTQTYCIEVNHPTPIVIRNNTFIGDGPTGGSRGIHLGGWYLPDIRNNLFVGVDEPMYIGSADRHFGEIGINGFYDCGNTDVVKLDTTEGFAGGTPWPDLVQSVILSENPFVDMAGGDLRLKENSEARGRGILDSPQIPGGTGGAPQGVACDLGAFAYGAPNLPQAGRFI